MRDSGLYRLYIDESGTLGYSQRDDLGSRYLSLTGVIVAHEVATNVLQPEISKLKRLLTADPDELPVLHRDDIVKKSGPFAALRDSEIQAEYNDILLNLLRDMEYFVITAVLDKKAHLTKYGDSAQHPYHYCLSLILERYVKFLHNRSARGDVHAESRGGREDIALKSEYRKFHQFGTFYISGQYVKEVVTSSQLKLNNKLKGVCGLELADLLALPSKLSTLEAYGRLTPRSDNFTFTVMKSIEPKYVKSPDGKIVGYGKKLV